MTDKLYCAAPWRGLHITTAGEVKPCCSGAHGFGNINHSDVKDILDSKQWQELRQYIAKGEIPPYCGVCVRQGNNNSNERQWHNRSSPNIIPTLEYQSPAILDVRWSNACNLMCVYCNPHDSSLWAKKLGYPLLTKRKDYYSNVIDYVAHNSKNLKTVALIGGEPLLIPQCVELLAAIPNDVEIHVITNLSIDLSQNPAFQKLSSRPNVRWSISFENIGSQFEFVRRGANWHQLIENLKIMKNLSHGLDIHAVLNILSLASFNELVNFAISHKIKIVPQILEDPRELDLRLFPTQIVDDIKNNVYDILSQTSSGWLDKETVYHYFSYDKSKNTDQIEEFYKFMQANNTDTLQFQKLWPELNNKLELFKTTSV